MFENLQALPPDAILGLIAEFNNDERTDKIDLGVGVYRTGDGRTPVLDVVKVAEQRLVETQDSKAYLGTAGYQPFNAAMQELTFASHDYDDRLTTLQGPGGSGSLRVAAGLLLRARESAAVWVSDPTWNNHVPLLGGAGLDLKPYPYYDTDKHVINIDAMLDALRAVPKGDTVLLHACCHNPCGLDPSEADWRAISEVIVERELLPFIDMAYQGFAQDIDTDAFSIRHLVGKVPEMIVANSCSKNFGLYRDRVGSLSVLSADTDARGIVATQLSNIVRTIYSVPPDHGAAVVAMILNDKSLRANWLTELAEMRGRLNEMRVLLRDALQDKAPDHDFSHLGRTTGMFCFLGLTPEQVERIKREHGVYMIGSSRINIAGVTNDNVDYLASAIVSVI